MEINVKTEYVPERYKDCLIPEKVYKATILDYCNNLLAEILDEQGAAWHIFIGQPSVYNVGCHYLDGNFWEIIED